MIFEKKKIQRKEKSAHWKEKLLWTNMWEQIKVIFSLAYFANQAHTEDFIILFAIHIAKIQ